jgi:hypothetical protein
MTTGADQSTIEKKEIVVTASENTMAIAELFGNRSNFDNKVVRIRGEVTKYNPAIMNMNWFHVQDGTEFNGEFDLTVTTTEEVSVGEVIVFEGTVALNKDFGAGYKYGIIVENAKIIRD